MEICGRHASPSPGEIGRKDTRPEQASGSPNPPVRLAEHPVELRQTGWGTVGQRSVALRPHELRRVEFGGITWEVFYAHPWMLSEKGLDLPASMNRALIPQQDDRAADLSEQVGEKGPDIQTVQGASAKLERQGDARSPRGHREGTDRRDAIVFVQVVEDRGVAAGRPGAGHVGDEQKA